jgi:small GTP-binding protein
VRSETSDFSPSLGNSSDHPMTSTAAVSIVGRPNVGKSTIFNRLVGRKQAIVHDQPGVTRDRNVAQANLDEDWPVLWIDTGGLMLDEDPLGLNQQVRAAIDESDLVLLVVDGREGVVPADQRIVEQLRPLGKSVLLVVNKGENQKVAQGMGEFYTLGYPEPILVSAEHGLGFDELRRPDPRRPASPDRRAGRGRGAAGGDRGASERRQVFAAEPYPGREPGPGVAGGGDDAGSDRHPGGARRQALSVHRHRRHPPPRQGHRHGGGSRGHVRAPAGRSRRRRAAGDRSAVRASRAATSPSPARSGRPAAPPSWR